MCFTIIYTNTCICLFSTYNVICDFTFFCSLKKGRSASVNRHMGPSGGGDSLSVGGSSSKVSTKVPR